MRGSRFWLVSAGMGLGYLDHNVLRDPAPLAAAFDVAVICVSLWLAHPRKDPR